MIRDMRKKVAIVINEDVLKSLMGMRTIVEMETVYSKTPHRTFKVQTPGGKDILMVEIKPFQFIFVDLDIVLPNNEKINLIKILDGKAFAYTATRNYINFNKEYLHRFVYRMGTGDDIQNKEVHHKCAQFDNTFAHLSACSPDEHHMLHSDTDRHTVWDNYIRISCSNDFSDLLNELFGLEENED